MDDSTTKAEVEQSTAEIGVDELEKVGHQEPEKEETDTGTETDEVVESTEEVEGEGGEEEPEETVDFDIGGKKLSIAKSSMPDEIRDAFQNYVKATQATLTKKSQEVTEMSKSLEARETAVKQLHTLQATTIETYAKGRQLQNEIAQYEAALTPELMQTDPDNYRLHSDALSAKRGEFNALHTQHQQQDQALIDAQTKEQERLVEQGKASLERRIKGFSTKVEDIVDYVSSTYGIKKEQIRTNWALTPAVSEMAFKAMLFDKLQAKRKTTATPTKAVVVPIKPTKGKGSKVLKDLGSLSPTAYSQEKARRIKAGTWERSN